MRLEDLIAQRPYMLRRLTQLFIIYDRKISQRALAEELNLSVESVSKYFKGDFWMGEYGQGRNWSKAALQRLERDREEHEDQFERAIERLSKKVKFLPPRILGTPEETYINDAVVLPSLMRPGA